MNDQTMKEAAIESGDEYLNGEAAPQFTCPYDTETFIDGEVARFRSYLDAYITGRIDDDDYLS